MEIFVKTICWKYIFLEEGSGDLLDLEISAEEKLDLESVTPEPVLDTERISPEPTFFEKIDKQVCIVFISMYILVTDLFQKTIDISYFRLKIRVVWEILYPLTII